MKNLCIIYVIVFLTVNTIFSQTTIPAGNVELNHASVIAQQFSVKQIHIENQHLTEMSKK